MCPEPLRKLKKGWCELNPQGGRVCFIGVLVTFYTFTLVGMLIAFW